MSKIHYLHLRRLDKNDNIANFGGTTIAYREGIDGGVEFAEARCSPKDNFVKAYGRAKAAGRLNSDRHRSYFHGSFNEFRRSIYAADQ